MKILTELHEYDVDIGEMTMLIDDIYHTKITKHTGITMSHDDIALSIMTFINNNNKAVMALRRSNKEMDDILKKEVDRVHKKIMYGETVKNTHGIINKIKYYILGYVIDED